MFCWNTPDDPSSNALLDLEHCDVFVKGEYRVRTSVKKRLRLHLIFST